MTRLLFFLLGLAVGSFLNVVIFRLGTKKSIIKGRSFCPHCRVKIFWYDNLPLLSFLILRGRCRHCQKKISIQYPLVELVTAVIFVWFYIYFGLSIKYFIYLIFSCSLLIIFVYDLKHYLILDVVTIPAIIFAFLANLYLGLGFWSLILGALIGSGFFAFQYIISQGKWVGGGDGFDTRLEITASGPIYGLYNRSGFWFNFNCFKTKKDVITSAFWPFFNSGNFYYFNLWSGFIKMVS